MTKSSKPGLVPARKQPLYRQLETAVDREDLAASLALTGNPRAERVLAMMLDPAYARFSLGQLCSRAGLSGGEVMRLFCQRQLAVGLMNLADHLPALLEDTALAARGRSGPCWKCRGAGTIGDSPCPDCQGTGDVHVPGDIRALRLVLQVLGMLRK